MLRKIFTPFTYFKRKHYTLLALGIVLLIGSIASSYIKKAATDEPVSAGYSIGTTFQEDLSELQGAIDELSTLLQENRSFNDIDNIKQHLSEYSAVLLKAKDSCDKVIERYSLLPDTTPDELADSASNSRSLCLDVDAVVSYANDISEGLAPYMDYDIGERPTQKKYNELSATTQKSIDYLQDVDPRGIEDPGISEVIIQLENTKKMSDNAKGTDAPDGDLISAQIVSDRQNFINARSYFWHNTVVLGRLQAAIQRVHGEF